MLNQIILNKKTETVFNKDPSKANKDTKGNLWLYQPFSEMGSGYVPSCIMTRGSKYGGQGKNKERKFTDITDQNFITAGAQDKFRLPGPELRSK